LVNVILDDLRRYCDTSNAKLSEPSNENRKKLFLVNSKTSHHDEIDERLSFLRYIASISDFKISKNELGAIYDLLMKESKIVSDKEEFLQWCKGSCEQSSQTTLILDLNEVGEFFTEKMNNGDLDVKNLPVVGFEFLQHYFLSANEKDQKLLKTVKVQK
jgi:hypothetical protein